MPLLSIVLFGLAISTSWQPFRRSVLAYATSMSTAGLLESTNEQRSANGRNTLTLNSKLNQAAQAKANDMVARNYWSHNTPDGNEPWIFIDQAGYDYQQAGENLAYGFATSADTVAGWMNSPSHKANLLETGYLDVGFGFANSSNYQNSGQQTIVVAMYAKPRVAAASTPAPTPPPSAQQPAPTQSTIPTQPTNPSPQPTSNTQAQPGATAPSPSEEEETPANAEQPVTTSSPVKEPAPYNVSRIQALTNGQAPWSLFVVGMLSGLGAAYLVIKHGLWIRRVLIRGERFVLHHSLLDVTIVAFVALCIILSRSVGVIR